MSAEYLESESQFTRRSVKGPARPPHVGVMLALTLALLIGAGDARARAVAAARDAGAPAVLSEVVVTAQKYAQNIQTVPEPVVAISATELAAQHITKVDDLGNVVSDLDITTRFDHTPDVVMRGVGAFGIDEGVAFYMNGVQMFDGQTVRMNDIQSIEVLKGPQGALYGGNAIGGAIKFITKLPTDTPEFGSKLEYGAYRTRTVSSFASGPLVPGSLEARISAFYTRTDGYQYDPFLGRNVDAGKEYGGLLTLLHKTAGTTVALYLDVDQLLTGAENQYYRPSSATDYSYQVTDGTQPSFNRTLYSVTLRVGHDLTPTVKLVSISSFFHSGEGGITDVDKGPVPFLTAYQFAGHRVASEELRFLSRGAGHSKWLIGLFAQANDEPNNYTDSESFNGNPADIASYANPGLYSGQYTNPRQAHREYAVFGNEQYSIGAWSVQAGARLDYNWSRMTDSINGITAAQHGTEFMPRFAISYQFTPGLMGYANIARGFEPGDLTEGANASGSPVINTYLPETLWSYELGVKSTLAHHRVLLDGDVFYMNFRNRLYQTNKFELGQFVGLTTNIGNSRNYGVELEMDALLGLGFKLDMSAGMTRAVWGNTPYFDPNLNFQPVNLSGRFATNTPAYTGSVGLSWSHRMTGGVKVGANVHANAIGRSYWDPTNEYYQPAYRLLSAGIYADIGNWTLRAHGSNLLNAPYNTAFISAAEVGAPFNVAGIGPPRTWDVSVSYDFN